MIFSDGSNATPDSPPSVRPLPWTPLQGRIWAAGLSGGIVPAPEVWHRTRGACLVPELVSAPIRPKQSEARQWSTDDFIHFLDPVRATCTPSDDWNDWAHLRFLHQLEHCRLFADRATLYVDSLMWFDWLLTLDFQLQNR